jgi:hypothetical protein
MMRATFKVFLALGLAALLASPALAQGQRKGGFGRGGGMFGGPGGLVSNKSVQKELKLTDDQAKKATEAVQAVREKHQEEFQGLRDLSPEERGEKMRELTKTMNDEQMKALADILNADQIKRLKQISLQARGNQAFADAEVQKDLKLTDDQKDKIKTINEDFGQEMRSLFQSGGDFQENQKKMASMRKEAMDKVVAVLTDDQKKAWKDMTGEPFEVKFEAGQFGGRRGKKKDGV